MKYNKSSVITPTILYTTDIEALDELLHQQFADQRVKVIIHANSAVDEHLSNTTFNSVQSLLSMSALPKHLDQLTIEIKGLDDNGEVTRGIRVFLCKRISDMHIYSKDDHHWMLQTNTSLKNFFKAHRPWYWYFAQSVPPVLNVSVGIALLMIGLVIVSKTYSALFFPILLVVSAAVYFAMGLTKRTFRYSRLCMFNRDHDARPNFELFALSTHAGVLTLSVVGMVVMTAGKI